MIKYIKSLFDDGGVGYTFWDNLDYDIRGIKYIGRAYRKLKEWYKNIVYFFYVLKCRIKGEYTYKEIADLNTTFCEFMLPRLKKFKELKKFYAVTFEEDYQKYKEDPSYEKDLEKNSEKLNKEIDEMIFAMENHLNEDTHNPYEFHCGKMIIKDGKITFGPITPAQEIENDLHIKTYQSNYEREKKGFELLGKRFINLNDW